MQQSYLILFDNNKYCLSSSSSLYYCSFYSSHNIFIYIIIINLYFIFVTCTTNNISGVLSSSSVIPVKHHHLGEYATNTNSPKDSGDETEIIVIDNAGFRPYAEHHLDVYHLEDFFWTGSGDGGQTNGDGSTTVTVTKHGSDGNDVAPTVYLTSTVTSTLIITRTPSGNENDATNCSRDCGQEPSPSILPLGTTINPTKTSEWENVSTTTTEKQWWSSVTTTTNPPGGGSVPFTSTTDAATDDQEVNTITIVVDTHRYRTPDRRYWIITILEDTTRQNDTLPLPPLEVLENRLAILYHIAFYRQQQKHLGIQNNLHRVQRSATSESQNEVYIKKRRSLQKINVQIHNVSTHVDNNDLELVYSVRVAGQPVSAKTAATDMRLVTDDEVVQQMGPYAVKTKAEPYLKDETVPLGLARYENTWLFIATSVGVLIILIILLILIIFGIQNRSKAKRRLSVQSKSIIGGHHLQQDHDDEVIQPVLRTTAVEDAEVQTCGRPFVRNIHVATSSSIDSTSSSDTGSVSDASPASRRRYPDDLEAVYKDVVDATNIVAIRRAANDVRSAHSYLSMPSVKNFPRGSIPEPLSRVLEPVSIRHLDDGMITPIESPVKTPRQPSQLTRHGSMQEAEDPGVIGPLVWNQHCQRLNSVIDKEPPNVGRMKRRFQELLDDAFSLFGSRSVSPEDHHHHQGASSNRAQSAYPRLSSITDDVLESPIQRRPKTSDPRRKAPQRGVVHHVVEPRCAWAGSSGAPSPLVRRPLSAGGVFHRPTLAPHVCPIRILPEGRLNAADAAVPVIEAIKSELQKCGTPRNK